MLQIKWKQDVKNPMRLNKKDDLIWLSYDMLDSCGIVKHGFSTRFGGVSAGVCSTMNLSFTRGDNPDAVLENYKRIASALDIDVNKIVASDQTHTTNVKIVTDEDCGKGIFRPKDYTDIDGLITNVPGITLATYYADCVPLYFVDPVHKAIGLSHSGWKGTVHKMGKVTIEKMKETFDTDPKDLICAIGPSICQDCYEVSEDVARQFANSFPKDKVMTLGRISDEGQKYQLDLWKANELVLLEAGVLPEKLSYPGICTCCNPEFLFSHRASKGKRGNLAAFLCLE